MFYILFYILYFDISNPDNSKCIFNCLQCKLLKKCILQHI